MEPVALLDCLVGLAEEAGIRVRVLPRSAAREGETLPASGLCRLRGEWVLILAAGEPLSARIDAVAEALRRQAGSFLEGRFLPPAVRERLEPTGSGAGSTGPRGGAGSR